MGHETSLALLAAAEIAAVLVAMIGRRFHVLFALAGLSMINMLMITMTGSKMTAPFGCITNVGNVFFAAVLLSQAVVIERYGDKTALAIVGLVFGALVMTFVLGQMVKHVPGVPGNEAHAAAIDAVLSQAARITFASFISFAIVNSLFVWLYRRLFRWPLAIRYAAVAVLMQILDTVIFFGVAFGGILPLEAVAEVMLAGLVIKSAFALLTVPVVQIAVARRRAEAHGACSVGRALSGA